jgi:hypothetical protein
MKLILKLSVLATTSMLLSGCTGGNPPKVGYFVDSAVEGLTYTTPTQSGTTGADGSFSFREGESVTFFLYGKELISPKGFKYLTPFDVNDTTLNPNYSINLVRFLMAIDADGNPSNGIKLPEYNQTLDIDFNLSIKEFEDDSSGNLEDALADIAPGSSLPSVEDAVNHINESLSKINPNYNLNFEGRTGSSVIKNSACTINPDFEQGFEYTFGARSVTSFGDDSFNNNDGTCTGDSDETENRKYSTIPDGELFACAPTCSYKELNRVSFVPKDDDGRTAVVWMWHTPNTNTILYVKTILIDPKNPGNDDALSTFSEFVTLD